MDKSWQLGLCEALVRFADGSLDRQGHLDSCRRRMIAVEPAVHAFTTMAPTPRDPPGDLPLAGIALGVKDLFDTADLPTAYGARTHAGHQPKRDATLVARLRALGAHVAGKTVTTEFAWLEAGPTRNPWGLDRTPGGSSSGSAAAVASGSVPLAIGTQTFGSIIRPAAFCGVVGFKPGHGVLPLEGAHPLSPSLDHAGLFARHVADVAHVHARLTGAPQPGSQRPERLILDLAGLGPQLSGRQHAALAQAVETFRAHGVVVEKAPSSINHGRLRDIADIILAGEAAGIFGPLLRQYPQLLGDHITALVTQGEALPPGRLDDARRESGEHSFPWPKGSVVLTAPALDVAPPIAEGTGNPAAAVSWTVLGVPTITLPWMRSAEGLPLGLHLVAGTGDEGPLLSAAGWCEGVRPALGFPEPTESPAPP